MNAIPKFLKTGAESSALQAKVLHGITGKAPTGQADTPDTLAKLPVWQQRSTTLEANVFPTGVAIMPRATEPFKLDKRQREILRSINFRPKDRFIPEFLNEVVYWHSNSTNGRWNEKLGRFERWGAQSVKDWINRRQKVKNPNPDYKWHDANDEDGSPQYYGGKTIEKRMIGVGTFRTIRKDLEEMGLIEHAPHFRHDPKSGYVAPNGAGLAKGAMDQSRLSSFAASFSSRDIGTRSPRNTRS